MKNVHALFTLVASMLGFLGVAATVAAAVIIWFVGARLTQTNEMVFDGMDKSLAAVRDRVLGAQRHIQKSKITAEEIGQSIRNRVQKETTTRVASRFELTEKAGQLSLVLQQADLWLETSGASIQEIQQAVRIASSLGAPIDAMLVEPLLEKLETLRRQLKQSAESIAGIRKSLAQTAVGESLDERNSQAARLAVRVMVTLGNVDSRLGESADNLINTKARVLHLKTKTHIYIVTAEICVLLLIAWMAAGQVALCRQCCKYYRHLRSAT